MFVNVYVIVLCMCDLTLYMAMTIPRRLAFHVPPVLIGQRFVLLIFCVIFECLLMCMGVYVWFV